MYHEISKLKDKHSGEDIWIVLAGATLDYVSHTFFENKTVLGINQVFKHFPVDYILMKDCLEEPRFPRSIKQLDEMGIPLIFCEYYKGYSRKTYYVDDKGTEYPDITQAYESKNKFNAKETGGVVNRVEHKNSYMFKHNPRTKDLVEELKDLGEDELIVSKSSVTSLLHLAAYMGAKNIILCGHDCGTLDKKLYYRYYTEKDWVSADNWGGIDKWVGSLERESKIVRTFLMKKYGVNIHSLNPFLNLGLEGHKYEKSK